MPLNNPRQDDNAENLSFNQTNFLRSLAENLPGGLASLVGPTSTFPGITPASSPPPSVFSGNYQMGPDESGWEPKGPIQDLNTPQSQGSIPAGQNVVVPTPSMDAEVPIQFHPKSRPLIEAIESGYADKKIGKPLELIREGIQTGEGDLIDKGHQKLKDALRGQRTFGERFADAYFRNYEFANTTDKMASDVVMNEIAHATGIGMPDAEEVVRLGLIKPEELVPGEQTQTIPGMTTPGYGGFTPEMQPLPAPSQAPTTKILPGTLLKPFQSEVATSRQKAIQSGLAYKAALAASRGEFLDEKAETERIKRDVLLPEQIQEIKSRRVARQHLNDLHDAQIGLTEARTEWYKQLPGLRRELAGNTSSIELEALQRVQTAIRSKQPIDKADWLIADRWLRKGLPPYMMNFLGQGFNRFTGEKEVKGKAFGWLGLPEPPSTTDAELAEANEVDDDLLHQVGAMIGSLLQGITGKGPDSKPETKPETGLSAAEKSELEQLRKKHGRSK